jgi:hypothetical protein
MESGHGCASNTINSPFPSSDPYLLLLHDTMIIDRRTTFLPIELRLAKRLYDWVSSCWWHSTGQGKAISNITIMVSVVWQAKRPPGSTASSNGQC